MQVRFIKDFAIALIVILLLAFAIRLYSMNVKRNSIPDQSRYTDESVTDTLKARILSIESSIQDRQNFVFSVRHDPLRQGNIIKDRFDLTKEFEEMLRNTFRPTGTYIDQNSGKRLVTVEYQDKIFSGGVGDVIEGRRITWIDEKNIGIYFGGAQTLAIQPRPAMPDFTREDIQRLSNDQNY
ncbi:MAG: hypothetical protein K0B87_05975 [Candidatus Syntrophosphaera sp.]|nr:hypothetical protein [Candidatus Syntrophosphaera sp.]